MRHILDLTFMPPEEGEWYASFSGFRKLARSNGVDLHWITCKPGVLPVERVHREIESACGFLVRIPSVIGQPNEFLEAARSRINDGAPVIFLLDRNYYEQQNEFLAEFGIEGSYLGLYAKEGARNGEHARDLRLNRQEYPAAFRDPRLFGGVESLFLDITQAIRLHGEAQSLLALPSGFGFSVDTKTDLEEDDWPSPEFTCIAGYFGRNEDKRRIVAINTALLRDRFVDGFGDTHYGIEGGDNAIFAENLLSFASEANPPPISSKSNIAHRLIEQVERNYYDFTRAVLTGENSDWWELVPTDVRERAEAKKRQEQNSVFPASAYMDLLDYRKIWRSHWEIFKCTLAECGFDASKNRALKYFHELNEIRKLVAHPTKSHSIRSDLSDSQLRFLEKESTRSISMWRKVCSMGTL